MDAGFFNAKGFIYTCQPWWKWPWQLHLQTGGIILKFYAGIKLQSWELEEMKISTDKQSRRVENSLHHEIFILLRWHIRGLEL